MSNSRETVMQSDEGGFLRGFVDYFFHRLRGKGLYDDKIIMMQPIEEEMYQMLVNQDCEYNLLLRGINNKQVVDEHTHVTSISRALNPYTQYKKYMKLAESPDLRVIVSNTIGAGIEYLGTKKLTDTSPKSYPARLTQFLYKRSQLGLKGFIPFPCELIDNNADNLKKCILQYIDLWKLGSDFKNWLENESDFCNTLVDGIMVGYPRGEVEELTKQIDYTDNLIDTTGVFHLWVIEDRHEDELPFNKVGCNIVRTDDTKPYKKRKIRILNGSHTSMALSARLYGLSTVGEYLKGKTVSVFLKKCIFEGIVPTLGNAETGTKFDEAVPERFSNPFIKHQLLSIVLDSVNKFQVRVLPTILEYKEKLGEYPAALTFPMAALVAFHGTNEASGGADIMEFMKIASVKDIMKREDCWHSDLAEMTPLATEYYNMIQEKGMVRACKAVLA